MRFVIQRVKNAKVEIDGVVHGKIDGGFLVLVGVTQTDDEKIADAMVNKLVFIKKILYRTPVELASQISI